MHDHDRFFGHQALSLTYILRGIFAPSPEDMLYIPDDGLAPRDMNGGVVMKPVPMTTFARFYIAGETGRVGIVKRFLEGGGGSNPYRSLTAKLKEHLKSGDIEGLRNAGFAGLDPEHQADLESAKMDCIALWTAREASYFKAESVGVPLGTSTDLVVRVNPEIGMKNADGERVLKLHYSPEPMDNRKVVLYHYLFGEAHKNLRWAGLASGIWDVRRRTIPFPPALPDDMESRVSESADDFRRLWDSLLP